MEEDFDYIIVGAGSAGCVLANKLSEDKRIKIIIYSWRGANKDYLKELKKYMIKELTCL